MKKPQQDTLISIVGMAILVLPLLSLLLFQEEFEEVENLDSDDVSIGEKLEVWSDVLGEDREYLVYLPASYNDDTFSERAYPVLYLLDGRAHFHSGTGVVQFLSEDANGTRRIPEMIVVAIPNTHRTRDLTPTHTTIGYAGEEEAFLQDSGGGDEFLRFLREELFPEVDDDYRTLPHRTLVGHSFGGLIALHALVHQPGMFQHTIAIDPSLWWDEQQLVSDASVAFQPNHGRSGSVYISLANNPAIGGADPMIMENAGRTFASILADANTDTFSSTMGYYENDDHGSVPLISLYDGLLRNFAGYEIDINELIEDPTYVVRHYDQVADSMGIDFPPPEAGINDAGYFFIYALEDYEAAIQIFSLNVELYPDSFNAYDSLGEAFMKNGETERAIEAYEKSLELNPENENAIEQIAEMSGQTDEN